MTIKDPITSSSKILMIDHWSPEIITLTLNNPNKYNILCEKMLSTLQAVLNDIAKDDDIKVVIILATGKAFCAGHDLKEMLKYPDRNYYEDLFNQCSAVMLTIKDMPQIVIAGVQGLATAAGCQLVCSCDLAIASNKATFAVSGINLGLFCSTPSVALSRNISQKHALKMLTTGDFIDAKTAAEYGIINEEVEPENLEKTINSLASQIARKTPEALKLGKSLFYKQIDLPVEEAYYEASQAMAKNMLYPETTEKIQYFLNKESSQNKKP